MSLVGGIQNIPKVSAQSSAVTGQFLILYIIKSRLIHHYISNYAV